MPEVVVVAGLSLVLAVSLHAAQGRPCESPGKDFKTDASHVIVLNLTATAQDWPALFLSGGAASTAEAHLAAVAAAEAALDPAWKEYHEVLERAQATYERALVNAKLRLESDQARATTEREEALNAATSDAQRDRAWSAYEQANEEAAERLSRTAKALGEELEAVRAKAAAILDAVENGTGVRLAPVVVQAGTQAEAMDLAAAFQRAVTRLEADVARAKAADAAIVAYEAHVRRARAEGASAASANAIGSVGADGIKALFTQARLCLDSLEGRSDTRLVSTRGETLRVYSIYGGDRRRRPVVKLNETPRRAQIAKDFETLLELVVDGSLPVAQMVEARDVLRAHFLARQTYVLTEKRAELTVSLEARSPARSAVPRREGLSGIADAIEKVADSMASGSAGAPPTAKPVPSALPATLITGPAEHWFLSVHVNVSRFSDLEYGRASRAIEPKENSPRFLIGASYFLGDLASDASWGPFVTLLVEPSRRPTGAIGAGLGLRIRPLKAGPFELDTMSPYIAYIRTSTVAPGASAAGEASQAGAPPTKSSWHLAGGITFNLDKVAGWVKEKK